MKKKEVVMSEDDVLIRVVAFAGGNPERVNEGLRRSLREVRDHEVYNLIWHNVQMRMFELLQENAGRRVTLLRVA